MFVDTGRQSCQEQHVQRAEQNVKHVRHPNVGGKAGVKDEPTLQPGANRQYPQGPLFEDTIGDVTCRQGTHRTEQGEQCLGTSVEQSALLLVDLVPQQLDVHLHLDEAGHR
uniref:Uncharacterized protein n=1 Tax=Anopheles coluzzii TaxID=1518534 RepID=A0A8W7PX89_ANOCL